MRALTIFSATLLALLASAARADDDELRLVVQITVDQLRGDMPGRFKARFGEGGFRRLMDKGLWYSNAHYRHATTLTAVGHATLFTGGNPPEHGLVGNEWADPKTGRSVYCVEDPMHVMFGVKRRAGQGTSPKNLTSSTIGDELFLASAGRAKIFSLSIKDRGAILPGGHRGKAFWFDKGLGKFTTSTYYYSEPPRWLQDFNATEPLKPLLGKSWELLQAREKYVFRDQDDGAWERPSEGLGRTFPHPYPKDLEGMARALANIPAGDELTLDLARVVIEKEEMGKDAIPDLLAVSLTVTDYIGHSFGPNSLEAEDNLIRLDRTLAKFFDDLDKRVGLSHTLIVLSADHGIDASPDHRREAFQPATEGKPATPGKSIDDKEKDDGKDDDKSLDLPPSPDFCCQGGRHRPRRFLNAANDAMKVKFKIKDELVSAFHQPSIYLDLAAIAKHKLILSEVETAVAEFLVTVPGIAAALTRTDIMRGAVPAGMIYEKTVRAFHPERSGQVILVQKPFWYLNAFTGAASMHGSPYPYDTHVPIFFYRPGIKRSRVIRLVGPEDIAPTLAQWLAVPAPSGAVGTALPESFEKERY